MKQSYEKPEIKKVGIKTEDNVLCVCKGTGMQGPQANDCVHYGFDCRDMYGRPTDPT